MEGRCRGSDNPIAVLGQLGAALPRDPQEGFQVVSFIYQYQEGWRRPMGIGQSTFAHL